MSKKFLFDITTCARPNILALEPYTTPRDDYPDNADITLLDANENAFGPSTSLESTGLSGIAVQSTLDPEGLQLHRYPDARQTKLKQLFCNLRNKDGNSMDKPLKPENICFGVGSDESIDGIIRAFCAPGKDKILICPPVYGMYGVSAAVNDVKVVQLDLDPETEFVLRPKAINEALSSDPLIKAIFLCSPGNPTGKLLSRYDIMQVLEHPTWNGVVVVDEAYIDFAPAASLAAEVNTWPNLIVIQTLSKAFGLAGIRLGIAFSQPQITRLLNNLKGPYNITAHTIAVATAALQPPGIALMEKNRVRMFEQRDRLLQELPKIPGFGKFLGGHDTNFVLVQFLSKPRDQGGVPDNTVAKAISNGLITKSRVLIRYRGKEPGCVGGLRITVGTGEQVDQILVLVRAILEEIYSGKASSA